MSNPSEDQLLSPQQVADILGYSVWTVRHMVTDGRLKGVKLSHRAVRIRRSEVDRFISEAQAIVPAEQSA